LEEIAMDQPVTSLETLCGSVMREPIASAERIASAEPITEDGLGLSGESIVADEPFTEDELAELALAADPEMPLHVDAVPMSLYLGRLPMMLPQWYMPPALFGRTTRWRTALVLAIVVALVMIEAYGLCSTYGSA
jgi:hypothetical protein